MTSLAATATITSAESRQQKALESYEAQRVVWDRIQRGLAAKVHRDDPSETLPGTIYHHRLRNEELGILDAAVPASVRNGSNAWEMSLRGGGGGVRYVQIGKAYPYPLYCPIRDSDCVPLDSNLLMQLVPMDKIPPRNKPAAESEYFHDRQQQFRKYVKKKFSHFSASRSPLLVTGVAAPTSTAPVAEDDTVEPVVFIPANSHPTAQYVTEEPKSRPLSAVTGQNSVPPASQQPPTGPMLCFSTSHVSFTSAPGESAQQTVIVDNVGTTAVYYSWAIVPKVTIGEETPTDYFTLSDPAGGVLLPDDRKLFTFTMRAPIAGIFTKQYEFLTVPAGKERIVVQLRAVVLSAEINDVATTRLEAGLHKKAMRDAQRQTLTEAVWRPDNHVLDHANIEIELRNLTIAKAKKLAELSGVGELQEGTWNVRNAPLGIPYNEAVYAKIAALHRTFHAFLASIDPRHTTAKDWDGSVKSLMEDFAALKDLPSRNAYVSTLNILLRCSRASNHRDESLHELLYRSAGRAAWGHAIDEMSRYVATARDLAEGKSVKSKTEVKVDPKGAGAKPPPKPAKPAKGAPAATAAAPTSAAAAGGDAKQGSGDGAGGAVAEKHPNFDKFYYSGVHRIVGSAVESIFGRADAAADMVSALTDRPFEWFVKKRLDEVIATQTAADVEVDATPETTKKKK